LAYPISVLKSFFLVSSFPFVFLLAKSSTDGFFSERSSFRATPRRRQLAASKKLANHRMEREQSALDLEIPGDKSQTEAGTTQESVRNFSLRRDTAADKSPPTLGTP
jgi:hypothetical protein